MASTISSKEKDKLPDWAVSTASQIEALGFSNWVFDWEYPVPALEKTERIQVRNEKHVGQSKEVVLYAEAMKRGDKFPPGVVSKDGFIVDFNTRQRAALKLEWPTFPVFIIQKDYRNAASFTKAQFHLLGAAFNTGGPKPLTRDEIAEAVREAAANDWDTNKVSQDLNVTRATVQGIFAQFKAEKRADFLGVPFNGTVPPSIRTQLGHRSEKLADGPFREIVRLTQDAGLNSDDVSDLTKRVVAVTSGDEERLGLIAIERAARENQIDTYKATNKRKPPLSSRVRTGVDFLIKHSHEVGELVDGNPNTRETYLAQAEHALRVLTRLVEAQRQANTLVEVN